MGAVGVGVGAWVAFSRGDRQRLVGQVVQVFEVEPRVIRVWCSELTSVVPVPQGDIIEEVPHTRPRVRRVSADGS